MEKRACERVVPAQDGTDLFCIIEAPENPRAILILVHGVAEHCGRYGYTTQFFLEQGYGVYRFDLRGHGRSGGVRGHVTSLSDYIGDAGHIVRLAASENPGVPLFMLGHSMGAFITACCGTLQRELLTGQILSGIPATELPLPDIRLLKRLPYKALGRLTAGNKLGALVSRDPEVVSAYREDPYVLKKTTLRLNGEVFIRGPRWLEDRIEQYTLPCLILHGGEDRIVTPAASQWFYEHIASKDKQRRVYPGLYHEILNEKEKDLVLCDINAWIAAHTEVRPE